MNDEEIQGLKAEEKEALSEYEYIDPVLPEAEIVEYDPVPTPVRTARPSSKNKDWIGGLILIGLGTIFLFNSFSIPLIANWWALFMFIPGIIKLKDALQGWRQDGQITPSSRGSLIGGLFLTVIGSAFLFNLDWGYVWPFFLIIAGIGALLSR